MHSSRFILPFLLAVAAAAPSCLVGNPSSGSQPGTSAQDLRDNDSEEAAFLVLINNWRAQNNAGPLVASPLLNQVAYDHSADMANNNYFSHTDLTGADPFQRMAAAGYNGNAEGENIAAGNSTAQDTFTQWQNSPPHNANMIDSDYHEIGIGRAFGSSSTYGWYWTTDFGDVIDSTVGQDAGSGSAAQDAGTPTSGGSEGSGSGTGTPTLPTPDAGAGPVDSGGGATCTGPQEVEPNDTFQNAEVLNGSVCGQLSSSSDEDWYSWTANQSESFVFALAAAGDANIAAWQQENGFFSRLQNSSSTSIQGSANSGATYLVRVRSRSGTVQSYKLTVSQ